MNKQFLIVIDGLNGAGKSTVSKLLHSKLPRAVRLSFDTIKRFISDYTPTEEYIKLTDRMMRTMTAEYLASGMHVIVDAFLPKAEFVKLYAKLAHRKHVDFRIYQIEAPHDVRLKRIDERPLVEGAKKKMDKAWLERNDQLYFENKYLDAVIFDSGKLTPEQIVNRIVKDLKR